MQGPLFELRVLVHLNMKINLLMVSAVPLSSPSLSVDLVLLIEYKRFVRNIRTQTLLRRARHILRTRLLSKCDISRTSSKFREIIHWSRAAESELSYFWLAQHKITTNLQVLGVMVGLFHVVVRYSRKSCPCIL